MNNDLKLKDYFFGFENSSTIECFYFLVNS